MQKGFWKIRIGLILFSLGIPLLVRAQSPGNKIDSVARVFLTGKSPVQKIRVLDSLAESLLETAPEKRIFYAEKAYQISKKQGKEKAVVKSKLLLGKLYLKQNRYAKAMNSFELALKHCNRHHTPDIYWKIRWRIGKTYYNTGNFSRALHQYFEVLRYYEKAKEYNAIARLKSDIGVVYHRQKEYDRALSYYREGFTALQKASRPNREIKARLQTNIGLTYNAKGSYEKAAKHYLKSLKINKSLRNPHIRIVNIGNLAATYAQDGQYKKAENYFKKAIAAGKNRDNAISVAVNRGDLAILYLKKATDSIDESGKTAYLNKAVHHFKLALDTLKAYGDLRRVQLYSQQLARALKQKGRYRRALRAYENYMTYRDSVFNKEISKKMARLEIRYQFSKRMDSIQMLTEKRIAVRDAKLRANKKQRRFLYLGIFLLVIIGGLLIYQNRMRRKTNKKLSSLNKELNQANQIKTRLFGILTHDLRSPISNIIKFLRLHKNQHDILPEKKREQLEAHTVKSAENLLTTMEDILLWCKNQMEVFEPRFEKVPVSAIFKDFQPYFDSFSAVNIATAYPDDMLLNTDNHYLKTIIRNLTANAVKAVMETDQPAIKWEAFARDKYKILMITDNGKGAPKKQFQPLFKQTQPGEQTGFGLHLVRDMSQAIGCTIEVDSTIGKGTCIKLIFK